MHDVQARHLGQQRDRLEVLVRVVRQLVEDVRVDRQRADVAEDQRVLVVGARDFAASRRCRRRPACCRRRRSGRAAWSARPRSTRATISELPPGANGTTKRIGLLGQAPAPRPGRAAPGRPGRRRRPAVSSRDVGGEHGVSVDGREQEGIEALSSIGLELSRRRDTGNAGNCVPRQAATPRGAAKRFILALQRAARADDSSMPLGRRAPADDEHPTRHPRRRGSDRCAVAHRDRARPAVALDSRAGSPPPSPTTTSISRSPAAAAGWPASARWSTTTNRRIWCSSPSTGPCRRQGVGSALLAWLERVATVAGITTVRAGSPENNADALAFYRSHGYRFGAAVPGMYLGLENGVRLVKQTSKPAGCAESSHMMRTRQPNGRALLGSRSPQRCSFRAQPAAAGRRRRRRRVARRRRRPRARRRPAAPCRRAARACSACVREGQACGIGASDTACCAGFLCIGSRRGICASQH